MKHNHTPILGIFLASGLLSAFAGCRSFAAPSHDDTAIFNPAIKPRQYNAEYAAASDNSARLRIAREAASDASLTQRERANWLRTWRDLAFAEGKINLELLQALAVNPLASDVDANLLRAFAELAPATNPSK